MTQKSCAVGMRNAKLGNHLKLRVFLADHSVAMVTYCVTKIMPTCSPVIGQFFDTMLVASIDKKVVKMAHQNLSLGMCWKLF